MIRLRLHSWCGAGSILSFNPFGNNNDVNLARQTLSDREGHPKTLVALFIMAKASEIWTHCHIGSKANNSSHHEARYQNRVSLPLGDTSTAGMRHERQWRLWMNLDVHTGHNSGSTMQCPKWVSNKCNTKDTFVLEWNQGQEGAINKCPNTIICQNASHKLARQIEKLEDWVQPRLKPFEMPVRVQLDRKRASNKSSFKYEGDYPIKWKFQKVPGLFFLACPCLPEHWNRCHQYLY